MRVSILLADDHAALRQGVRRLVEREGFEVVAEARDGDEAVRLAGLLKPDVAVLEYVMPGMSGREAAQRIQQISPNTRSIILTMRMDRVYLDDVMGAGLSGYVAKSRAASDLPAAIRAVRRHATYVSACMLEPRA